MPSACSPAPFWPAPSGCPAPLPSAAGAPLLLVVGIDGPHHVAGEHLAAADRRQHVLDGDARQAGQGAFQLLVGEGPAGALEGALQDLVAEAGILPAHGGAGGAADRGARLAGDDEGFPGRRRRLALGADDLDLVAVLQLGQQRRHAAVDLAAHRRVADIGVHRIGEVDGRRAAGQGDEAALGREAEDLVVEELELRVLEELLRIVALGQKVDGAPQPLIGAAFLGEARIVVDAFLVEGVRRDAVFRHLVHVHGADLQLDALAAGPDHGGVDRAVVVLLRGRDVVLVAARAPSASWYGRRRAPGSIRRRSRR